MHSNLRCNLNGIFFFYTKTIILDIESNKFKILINKIIIRKKVYTFKFILKLQNFPKIIYLLLEYNSINLIGYIVTILLPL